MDPMLIAGTGGAGATLAAAVLWRRLRPARRANAKVPPMPRVAFRVLRTEEELSEALRRAAWSERVAADTCRTRADRYEAMLRPLGRRDAGVVDQHHEQPLSA